MRDAMWAGFDLHTCNPSARADSAQTAHKATPQALPAQRNPATADGARTLALMLVHFGMCRSAAVSLKERPQCGQGTSEGSGALVGGGGRSAPLFPSAMAFLYAFAARIASRSWLDLACQLGFCPPAAAPPTGLLSTAAAAAAAPRRAGLPGAAAACTRAAFSAMARASSGTVCALMSKAARLVWNTFAHAFCRGGAGQEEGRATGEWSG